MSGRHRRILKEKYIIVKTRHKYIFFVSYTLPTELDVRNKKKNENEIQFFLLSISVLCTTKSRDRVHSLARDKVIHLFQKVHFVCVHAVTRSFDWCWTPVACVIWKSSAELVLQCGKLTWCALHGFLKLVIRIHVNIAHSKVKST